MACHELLAPDPDGRPVPLPPGHLEWKQGHGRGLADLRPQPGPDPASWWGRGSDLRGRGRPLPPQLACPSGSEDRAAPSFECAVSASASFPVRAARLLLVSSKPSFAQVEAITRPWPLAGTQTRWRRRFNGFHAGPHGSRAAQDSHRGTPEGFQGLTLLVTGHGLALGTRAVRSEGQPRSHS